MVRKWRGRADEHLRRGIARECIPHGQESALRLRAGRPRRFRPRPDGAGPTGLEPPEAPGRRSLELGSPDSEMEEVLGPDPLRHLVPALALPADRLDGR